MRTTALMLLTLGAFSLVISLVYKVMPFRLPLTGADVMHAALVLLLAGAVAAIGSRT